MYQPSSDLCVIRGDETSEVFALKAALRSSLDREIQLRSIMSEQNRAASQLRAAVNELRLSLSLAEMELAAQARTHGPSVPSEVQAKNAAMWSGRVAHDTTDPLCDLETRLKRLRVDVLSS